MGATTGSATADEIRRTALELFSTAGYSTTTMREISAAVGIRAASLYNHFAAKEEILWDLTRTALDELDQRRQEGQNALPTGAGPVDRLRAFVDSHTRFHATHQREAALINRQLRGLSPAHYRRAVAMRDAYAAHLRTVISDGVAAGVMAVPDVKVTSFALLEMGMGLATWYRPNGPIGVADLSRMHQELAVKLTAPVRG